MTSWSLGSCQRVGWIRKNSESHSIWLTGQIGRQRWSIHTLPIHQIFLQQPTLNQTRSSVNNCHECKCYKTDKEMAFLRALTQIVRNVVFSHFRQNVMFANHKIVLHPITGALDIKTMYNNWKTFRVNGKHLSIHPNIHSIRLPPRKL